MARTPLLALLAALPLLAACNTINGIGQDVQAVGSGVSSAATYVQRSMFSPRDDVQTASITYREPTVSVGEACDPDGSRAGSGLPPCGSVPAVSVDETADLETSSVMLVERTTSTVRTCDPSPDLSGGDGLPPCRVTATRASSNASSE